MAINISVGGFTVLNGAVTDLRTHYETTRVAINAEVEGVHGMALPAINPIQGGILASDRRNPPQSRAFILCQLTDGSDVNGVGESRDLYRLTVTSGLRHSARKAGEHGTNEQSGNELALLLSRAADHILRAHMKLRSGIYNFHRVKGSGRPVPGVKGTWMYERSYMAYVRTKTPTVLP